MNITEPIFVQCRNKPAEIALCAPGTDFNIVSYARLASSVNNICHRIVSAGLASKSRVALFIDDPILRVFVLIALARLGIVTVSSSSPDQAWRFEIAAVIADKPLSGHGKGIVVSKEWALGQAGQGGPVASDHLQASPPDAICQIMVTQGINGEDKAVALTNGVVAARVDRLHSFLGKRTAFCSRTFIDVSLTDWLGFEALIGTLWRGGAAFLVGDRQQTMRALPIYKVQNMVTSPDRLQEMLRSVEPRDRYSFDAVFSAGSGLDLSLAEHACARLCPNMTKGYGSTEFGGVASMPVHADPEIPGAAGYVMPGIDLEIVDDDDTLLPQGERGSIRINGETGAMQYWSSSENAARAYRGGWFYPGDRGYLTKDNLLVLSGPDASN